MFLVVVLMHLLMTVKRFDLLLCQQLELENLPAYSVRILKPSAVAVEKSEKREAHTLSLG